MPHPESPPPERQPSTVQEYLYGFATRVFEADPGTEELDHAWRSLMLGITSSRIFDPATGERRYGIRAAELNEVLVAALTKGYNDAQATGKVSISSLERAIGDVREISIEEWSEYTRLTSARVVHHKRADTSVLGMLSGLYNGTIHYDDLLEGFEESLNSTDSKQTDT